MSVKPEEPAQTNTHKKALSRVFFFFLPGGLFTMRCYITLLNTLSELDRPGRSMLQLAFLSAVVNERLATLSAVSASMRYTPSSLKYTLGSLAAEGMLRVSEREIMPAEQAETLMAGLPYWINNVDKLLVPGIVSVRCLALLDSVSRSPDNNINEHAKRLSVPVWSANRILNRMSENGLTARRRYWSGNHQPDLLYSATAEGKALLQAA